MNDLRSHNLQRHADRAHPRDAGRSQAWWRCALIATGMFFGTCGISGCVTEQRPVPPSTLGDGSTGIIGVGPRAGSGSSTRRGASEVAGGSTGSGADVREFEVLEVAVGAALAPVTAVEFNGLTLPLVNPAGEYVAVQTGPAPTWGALLARDGGYLPPLTAIQIYRVQANPGAGRFDLIPHARLSEVGLLGMDADAEGFLIEAPQADGSRWIGYVRWSTGEVEWLVQDEMVNAFANLSDDGRLAWCRRPVGAEGFALAVDPPTGTRSAAGADEPLQVAPRPGADWLYPIWAEDGVTLFASYHAEPTPVNDLAREGTGERAWALRALDSRDERLLAQPLAERILVLDATRFQVYQGFVGVQDPTPFGRRRQLLFYHPGLARVCIFDPAAPGLTVLLAPRAFAATSTHGGGVLVANDEALLALDPRQRDLDPVELVEESFVPRRTASEEHPYLLFAPTSGHENLLRIFVMQLQTEPANAASASRSARR